MDWSSTAAAGVGLIGNAVGSIFTNRAQKKMMREQMAFNRDEAQKQRDWNESMYTKYQSPAAMRRQYEDAGYNPYLSASGNQIGSIGSGSSAADAGSMPTLQNPINGGLIGSIMNDVASAIKLSKDSDPNTPWVAADVDLKRAQIDKFKGDTNWSNNLAEDVFKSDPDLGRIWKENLMTRMTAETDRMELGNDLLKNQKVLQNLDIEAKTISNKYLDKEKRFALARQSEEINKIISEIDLNSSRRDLNRQQIRESAQRIVNMVAEMKKVMQETRGLRNQNVIVENTMWSYISAARAGNLRDRKIAIADRDTYDEFRRFIIDELKSKIHLNDAQATAAFGSMFGNMVRTGYPVAPGRGGARSARSPRSSGRR